MIAFVFVELKVPFAIKAKIGVALELGRRVFLSRMGGVEFLSFAGEHRQRLFYQEWEK